MAKFVTHGARFLAATAILLFTARAAHAAMSCEALAQNLQLPDTTITLAVEVPAGALKLQGAAMPGAPPPNYAALPAFCRVAGTLRPSADSDIRFEVWMPLAGWNGMPGMGHCAGGSGPSSIDMLGALDNWVETGKPPEQLVASNPPDAVARTRPLCAHPKVAKYTGRGSTDEAQNFSCQKP